MKKTKQTEYTPNIFHNYPMNLEGWEIYTTDSDAITQQYKIAYILIILACC